VCEALTHACSFPDCMCAASGRRYGEFASHGLAGQCVPASDGAACGGRNQPCGAGCCVNLVCIGGFCRCGDVGQPCCEGALGPLCGSFQECRACSCVACGAPGQACCGGVGCQTGASCDAGMCS
jgi:hypothetical protein